MLNRMNGLRHYFRDTPKITIYQCGVWLLVTTVIALLVWGNVNLHKLVLYVEAGAERVGIEP